MTIQKTGAASTLNIFNNHADRIKMANSLLPPEERNLTPDQVEALDKRREWGHTLLVIAGQGPLAAELQAQAASLGLTVRFAGQRRDVPALLAAADVFVLPSVWEGQSLILQEALRAGVPIVATRVGGNSGLLGEDAAILVPGGDAHDLAAAVRAVLGDPALAARLREAAAARARTLPAADEAVTAALAEYRHVAR